MASRGLVAPCILLLYFVTMCRDNFRRGSGSGSFHCGSSHAEPCSYFLDEVLRLCRGGRDGSGGSGGGGGGGDGGDLLCQEAAVSGVVSRTTGSFHTKTSTLSLRPSGIGSMKLPCPDVFGGDGMGEMFFFFFCVFVIWCVSLACRCCPFDPGEAAAGRPHV